MEDYTEDGTKSDNDEVIIDSDEDDDNDYESIRRRYVRCLDCDDE